MVAPDRLVKKSMRFVSHKRVPALSFSLRPFVSLRTFSASGSDSVRRLKEWSLKNNNSHLHSELPPNEIYHSHAHLQYERNSLFPNSWIYVGHLGQLETPGAVITGNLGGAYPIFIKKCADGTLRGFVNVCRHRAAQLLMPELQGGSCEHTGGQDHRTVGKRIQCPYHGWEYDSDTGQLAKCTMMKGVTDFKPKDYSLFPVSVQTMGSLVFANGNTNSAPLLSTFEGLEEKLDMKDYQFVERNMYNMTCNWKVFADNYLDGGYHIQNLHPGLASQLNMGNYRNTLFSNYSLQTCVSPRGKANTLKDLEVEGRVSDPLYAWLFPCTAINKYAHWIDVHVVIPVSERECTVTFDYFLRRGSPLLSDRTALVRELEASRAVQREDISICESVQRGLESSGYTPGRFGGPESPAFHFAQLLAAQIR